MKKAFVIITVVIITVSLPFLLIGAGLIVGGYITDERALTGDGYNLKIFLYAMGGFFIGLTLLSSGVIFLGMFLWQRIKGRQIKELNTYGKPGTAKILKLEDTGVKINYNPRVRLQLEISIPNYPPYFAQKTLTLSMIHLPRVQPGSIVNVLADPNEPHNENRIGLILE
jgi:hypothetical protein